jgi:hypothetical protein
MNINNTNRQHNVPMLNQQPEEKKCHGNRKDQHFRKKCRARGMKPKQIEKKLARRKQIQNKKNSSKTDAKHSNDTTMKASL